MRKRNGVAIWSLSLALLAYMTLAVMVQTMQF